MSKNYFTTYTSIIISIIVTLVFTTCSDTSDFDSSYEYNPAWVTITDPLVDPYITDFGSVHMSGRAFVSEKWFVCCTGSPTDTGVTVTWRNTTTGQSGHATQYIRYNYFLGPFPIISDHLWSADIPIALGNNVIAITAYDPDYSKTKRKTVIRKNDLTPPTIISVNPMPDATDVAVNTSITVNFGEEMDSSSINEQSFLLYKGNTRIDASVTYENKVATLTPSSDLTYNTSYRVSVSADMRDLAGLTLTGDFNWYFSTGDMPDVTPPVIIAVQPENSTQDVGLTQKVSATFNEPMNTLSINQDSFILQNLDTNNYVSGWIVYDDQNRKATFTPYSNFAFATPYQATVKNTVSDTAGNALVSDFIWTFTTVYDGAGAWEDTSTFNAPTARWLHTAVWNGSEMIIWGGYHEPAIYDLATDSWKKSSVEDIRRAHTAVWTGSEMLIWGGENFDDFLDTGLKYFPDTDTVTPISMINAPQAVIGHTGVWTGTELIIWGGKFYDDTNTSHVLNTGSRYDPATDTWQPMSTENAPEGRYLHAAVWTGTEMIAWGGSPLTNTGGIYNPSTDTWRPMSTLNAPQWQYRHTAVWTGSEMIVWGGANYGIGGIYNPSTDTWRAISTVNSPYTGYSNTAVWTGDRMITWGGYIYNNGGIYDPVTDTWESMAVTNAPSQRMNHSAVWTGQQMIIWGGRPSTGNVTNTGGIYTP